MVRRYDLIVIDLDGTLVRRDGTVSSRNRRAIDAAREAGIEVVIATGRSPTESRGLLEAVGYEGPLIAAGGSIMCDADGRTVARRALAPEVVTEVAERLVEHGHKALVLKETPRAGFDYLAVGPHDLDDASTWWFETNDVRVRHVEHIDDDPHPEDSLRAGAVARGVELEPLATQLREAMEGRAFLQHWSAVTKNDVIGSTTHLLEVFHPEVSKWTMVAELCGRLDLDLGRVATIGDGLNDVEMLAGAALGVAMANADRRAAAVADRTTADFEADGVALAIERMLDGEW
ncbi:MAG: HAD-IIB family hydrolase [Planctomycetota bacterium]